ncbi:MAG: DUF4926 domain-containing protein [Betaproteobacteria bacterium]|nr:DUF4926 domain-containing protein [Betaproteobacteria bacterium]
MKLLDTVALTRDLPEQHLPAGLVGVLLEEWEPGVFEVEFADLDGRPYARTVIKAADLLVLQHSRGLERMAA